MVSVQPGRCSHGHTRHFLLVSILDYVRSLIFLSRFPVSGLLRKPHSPTMSKLYEDIQFAPNQDQIRLLRLHPRTSSSAPPPGHDEQVEAIECDLYPVALLEAKSQGYEALSYTWGDQKNRLDIVINGQTTAVGRNLHAALNLFRNSEVLLWVDAVCINQEDNVEKSKQVDMMATIYSYAKKTRVWIGSAEGDSDNVMQNLARIGRTVIDREAYEPFITMATLSIKEPSGAVQAENQAAELVQDLLEESLVNVEDSLSLLTGFCDLVARGYWKRVWILQEIVLSRSVDVYCGKEKLDFAALHAAILFIIYMHVLLSKHLASLLMVMLEEEGDFPADCEMKTQFDSIIAIEIPPSASFAAAMRLRYHDPVRDITHNDLNLIQILSRIRVGREATDHRDRIFALLGMVADRDILRLVPNYEASCATVYSNAARAMIAAGQVDILAFSQWNKKDQTMPSWVPDWREEVKKPYGQMPWDTPYKASGSEETLEGLVQLDSSSHLKLRGYIVDSIESLKARCNHGKWLGLQNRREAVIYLNDIMTLCQISNEKLERTGVDIYSNPNLRERAYQRVPVADLYSTGFVRQASVEECHRGHAEVITDFTQWLNNDPNAAGLPITNTLRSYYNMMAEQVERRPFVTTKGFVGLAPWVSQEGDLIVVFPGAKFPYVIRRYNHGVCVLVGEAFVHGIMHGEYFEDSEQHEMEKFVLK